MIITVDHVRNEHSEAAEIGGLEVIKPSEKSKPVESVVGGAGEDYHTDRRANNSRKALPKTHLRVPNTAMFVSSSSWNASR